MKRAASNALKQRLWASAFAPVVCVSSAIAQSIEIPVNVFPGVQVTDAPLEYRQFDKVEITGSSIVRKEQTQALPVQTVTRADIQKSGKQSLAELLQDLPVMSNPFSPGMLGAVKSGFSGGAIHGMQTGTLVLVNGRRLAGFGRQTSFGNDNGGIDLNGLPLSAIDRVEVLTDGASSVYGTDAQTGVINIITRAERPGVEISVDHRMPDGQKGLGSRVDFSVGGGRLVQDGYSWFAAVDLQEQQELMGQDRPYASAGRYSVEQGGQSYWAYGSGLSAAQTSPTLSATKSQPWSKLWSADYPNGQCPDNKVQAWGQSACLDNTYLSKGLHPALRAARLHAQGQWLVDADTTAFAELSWHNNEQSRTYTSWSPYTAKISNTPGAPGYDLAVANGFDPAKGVWLLYSGSELGASSRWYDLQTRRLVAGLKGQRHGWNFNTSYSFSDNQASLATNSFKAYPNLGVDGKGVLTNTALLLPLSSNTPESQRLRQQLMGMVPARTDVNEGTSSLKALDFKASRSVGEIDGRDVLLAFGSDWRQESSQYENHTPGSGVPSYTGQRTVWAQFAEVQMPLLRDVETLASLRNDHYSDFGNTTHGKLSVKWTPSEQWLLRGAWGTSFRAPAIAQMQDTEKTYVSNFALNCTTALQAVAAQLGGQCPANGIYRVYSQGSSQLKPELSTQWNFGVRFSPDRNHTLSLDYWRIDMRDKINYLGQGIVFSDPVRYIRNYELNANNELQMFSPMINIGKTQTSGVDFSWAFRRPTDWGQLHMGVSGTLLLKSRYQLVDGEAFVDDLNTYSNYTGFVIPKLKTRWHFGFQQTDWQWWTSVNHVGGHDGGPVTAIEKDSGQEVALPSHRVPAWWTLDFMAMYKWSPKTNLRFGIENVFNRNAPLDLSYASSVNFGTNPMLANVWGRTVHLSMTHRF